MTITQIILKLKESGPFQAVDKWGDVVTVDRIRWINRTAYVDVQRESRPETFRARYIRKPLETS